MAQTKLAFSLCLLLCTLAAGAQNLEFSWKQLSVDGSRTGVTAPSSDLSDNAGGFFKDGSYCSPGGAVFRKGVTPAVAEIVIGAQAEMADFHKVISHSSEDMVVERPESNLSDWAVDYLMKSVAEISGETVDAGILNMGGIRAPFYKGPITKDDVLSMFPFDNKLCLVTLRGKDLRYWLELMASTRVEAVGGITMVIESGSLTEVRVSGLPLDDEREYKIATIDYLLYGGDGYFLSRNALSLKFLDCTLFSAMFSYVSGCEIISYQKDGRVIVR